MTFKQIRLGCHVKGISTALNSFISPFCFQAVNVIEAMKHEGGNHLLSGLEKAFEVKRTEDVNTMQRLGNRVSMTCRVVSRVHKKLFKF